MNDNKHYKKRLQAPSTEMVPVGEMGKLPPQALDMEAAVLGAMLLENEAYHEIADMLVAEAFYKEAHQHICQAIIDLHNRGDACDILTITQELKRSGQLEFVGGAYYISQLTDRISSSANMQFHMRIILQEWIKREMIRTCSAMIREAYEPSTDSLDLLDRYEVNLNEIQQKLFVTKHDDSATLYNKVLADNEILTAKEGTISGLTTGSKDLDKMIGGWQNTDMITVAARPGMGKTCLVLSFAKAAAKAGHPVAIFSLEMSAQQLYKRLISQETDIPLEMILRKGMDPATVAYMEKNTQELKKAPLYIDDTGGLTLSQFRRKARKMKREKKIELIIIDYLQLMEGESEKAGNREQDVSKISRGVKALAKELEIPIIALSQLSRLVESRQGTSKRPQLSDLRESGSIEQDSDMVMFIYRPEYYGMTQDENNQPTKGVADILIAKNRHGALDTVTMRFIGECVKFIDWRDHDHYNSDNLQPNNNFLP